MRLEGTNTIFNRVEPWNKLYTAQLRKIINPVPFVGRFVGLRSKVSIPRLAQPIGFDLLESDWVAPFGKGKNADLIIQLESELAKMPAGYYELHPRAGKYWNTKFAVTFANVKDGICEFVSPPNVGSIFRSPRFAPEDGFATNFTMVGDASTYNPPKLDQNFIFRIRSQLDDKGNVTNALHGKIYGPFEYTPSGGLKFQYLLNPKSNDRNLEFNPDKNCLQNLPRGEEIRDF